MIVSLVSARALRLGLAAERAAASVATAGTGLQSATATASAFAGGAKLALRGRRVARSLVART